MLLLLRLQTPACVCVSFLRSLPGDCFKTLSPQLFPAPPPNRPALCTHLHTKPFTAAFYKPKHFTHQSFMHIFFRLHGYWKEPTRTHLFKLSETLQDRLTPTETSSTPEDCCWMFCVVARLANASHLLADGSDWSV